jgi:hypothetical protein
MNQNNHPKPISEQLLEELREAYLQKGVNVDQYLLPGLSREEIVTKLRPLNIPIPEDLIQLYSWRNGQVENADWELDSLRFRDTTFINLDAAVKQYDDFRTAYGEGCTFENTGFDMDLAIPISYQDAAWYVMVCGPHKFPIPHPHPIVYIYYGMRLKFFSMETMLRSCIDKIHQSTVLEDVTLDISIREWDEIWEHHNPGIHKLL